MSQPGGPGQLSGPGRPPSAPIYGEVPRYGLHQPAPPPTSLAPPAPPTASRPTGSGPARANPPLATWRRRAPAFLLDFSPLLVGIGVFGYGYVLLLRAVAGRPAGGESLTAAVPGLRWMIGGTAVIVVALGWLLYNRWVLGGRTGQSVGKRALKLMLVGEETGAPIGAGYAFLRDLVHILDWVAYVGFLWPLWDDRRQTFADKIMRTVVLDRRSALTGPPAADHTVGTSRW